MKNLLKMAFAASLCISVSFAAPQKGTMTDSRDGKRYKTVKIGDQVWMAENLNFETKGSRCFNDKVTNCNKYGRLYTWAAAMDSAAEYSEDGFGCGGGVQCEASFPVQGICPDGWHLPSKEEYEQMVAFVGGKKSASKKLRSKKGWGKGIDGTDDYGFSITASGIYENEGFSGNEKSVIPNSYFQYRQAQLWSSTAIQHAVWFVLASKMQSESYEEFTLKSSNERDGSSVRCLKNEESASENISSGENKIVSIDENEVKEMIKNNQCIVLRDKFEDCHNLLGACNPTIKISKKGKNRIVSLIYEDVIGEIAKINDKEMDRKKSLDFVIGLDPNSNEPVLILSGTAIICQGNDCVNEGQLYSGFLAKDARFMAEGDYNTVNNWMTQKGSYKIKKTFENISYNLGYLTAQCKENKE